MKKMNKKGFTMAELLIVVAIIAVLVAIAIPIFTTQLEKSRDATDAANIRAAYAEVMTAAISNETKSVTVDKTQKTAGWTDDTIKIGGVAIGTIDAGGTGSVVVSYTKDASTVTIGDTTITVQ